VTGDILDELSWRGLVAQTTDEAALARQLQQPTTLYCGFDPTAPSLHLGSLVPLLALRRFQLAGHRPIALAGGATGLIGDPSGRSAERSLLTLEVAREWTERLRRQMSRFLDLDGPRGAILADNLDWTAPLSTIDFLRDVGKHFSVNVMLARESVSARLEGGGLSFTEFSYQLLQSMDYLELFRRHDCRLQVGATDQWGNITAGLDLVRRVEGASVHALTFPLITDASGAKLGKSTGGGSVWLDPAMTTPYAMYQYLINVDDRDAGSYLRLLTLLPREEIEALDAETQARPAARAAQRRLAQGVTTLVHGAAETARVEAASQALFGRGELRELDEPTLTAALTEAPHGELDSADVGAVELLTTAGVCGSNSEARRAMAEGGAWINNERWEDLERRLTTADLLPGGWVVVRRGRRTVGGVRVLG
jgi:tyrosyl-tRNA synthetase